MDPTFDPTRFRPSIRSVVGWAIFLHSKATCTEPPATSKDPRARPVSRPLAACRLPAACCRRCLPRRPLALAARCCLPACLPGWLVKSWPSKLPLHDTERKVIRQTIDTPKEPRAAGCDSFHGRSVTKGVRRCGNQRDAKISDSADMPDSAIFDETSPKLTL